MHIAQQGLWWGIIIYAIMYLLWSGLVIYGLSLGIISLLLRIGVLAFLTIVAARSLRSQSVKELVPVTLVWALCAIVFDTIFLVPFSGWELYASWSVWVGYALIVVFPLVAHLYHRQPREVA